MRKLVLTLVALIAVATFIQAYSKPAESGPAAAVSLPAPAR